MAARSGAPFFIGWLNAVPRPLARFLVLAAAAILGSAAGLGVALGTGGGDPGDGRFLYEAGEQRLSGIVTLDPYPVLHVPAEGETPARAILLAGQGKRGVLPQAGGLAGSPVEAGGIIIRRGSIDMLQVGGPVGLKAAEGEAAIRLAGLAPAAPVPLGRWRLTGEICDGKCALGAMRPGRGLAHKACANLCLLGGVPPIFMATGAVDGAATFLLADKDGGPLGDSVRDLSALWVEVEGEVERRGALHVLKIDLARVRVL